MCLKTFTFNLQHCHFERNEVESKNLKNSLRDSSFHNASQNFIQNDRFLNITH
jgi:hypothetical protein